ncbi:MAG: CHASE2 domain-containing protein [Candidatus Hydrogenedentota bacterium]|nr:MAG: CHASE2 domain-containing protein [Candidatus Hydrogenedentota bacterium]
MAGRQKERAESRSLFSRGILHRILIGLAAGSLVGLFIVKLSDNAYFRQLELISLDFCYTHRPQPYFRSDIGYIDYDDEALAFYGPWPWPRNRQVALVRTVGEFGARAVGYDVFFLEHSNAVFHTPRLEKKVHEFEEEAIEDPDAMVSEILSAFRDYDAEFAQATADAGNIFFAHIMTKPNADIARGGLKAILEFSEEEKKHFSEEKRQGIELAKSFAIPATETLRKHLYKAVDLTPVLPDLASAARGLGFAQIIKDLDPTVRLYPFAMYYDSMVFPSIAVVMLADLFQIKVTDVRIVPGKYLEFPDAAVPLEGHASETTAAKRKTIRVPINQQGQMLVNWAGKFYDHGLHVPYRRLSEIYSLMLAKEAVRSLDTGSLDASQAVNAARDAIQLDRILRPDEAGSLAVRVTAAALADSVLRSSTSFEDVLTNVRSAFRGETVSVEDVRAGVASAAVALHTLGESVPVPPLSSTWREEIERMIHFSQRKHRLDRAFPFYFAPKVTVPWGGTERAFSPADLEGKILMVGLTGVGTIDLNPTPFEKACPMVALHANALNTVLTQQFLRFPSEAPKKIVIVLAALLLGLLLAPMRTSRGALLAAVALAGWTGFVYWEWIERGRWIPWLGVVLVVILLFLLKIFGEFLLTIRERARVRKLFAAMVSPKVLRLMEEDPSRFSLTGERKHATMFFSWVDGFSGVTAGVSPDELSAILAQYLTPISEIIMDYDGYIDKYEGHIVMADFGVPLDDPDHPWKCCFSAVEQQQDIEAFILFVSARYGTDVHVSMGINTGYVSAGNMGSERKMQYTVMGDAVNVAARFMPANMIYGTDIITGEDTEPFVRDSVQLRELDRLLLKGKTTPTVIYEVMGWRKDAYLERRGDLPVPSALRVRWLKAPAQKIFGYARFWRKRYETFSVPMAWEIAEFFEGNLELAEGIMKNAGVWGVMMLCRSIRQLQDRLGISDASLGVTSGGRIDYQKRLEEHERRLEAVIERIDEAIRKGEKIEDAVLGWPELRLRATSFLASIRRLRRNLPKKSREGIEAVNRTLKAIREWLSTETADTGFQQRLKELSAEYERRVQAFFDEIASRPREYHEMMAVIGDLSSEEIRVRDLYHEALALHRERKWNEAIPVLENALRILPKDPPSKALLERAQVYLEQPPGPEWQGEFVQTKK